MRISPAHTNNGTARRNQRDAGMSKQELTRRHVAKFFLHHLWSMVQYWLPSLAITPDLFKVMTVSATSGGKSIEKMALCVSPRVNAGLLRTSLKILLGLLFLVFVGIGYAQDTGHCAADRRRLVELQNQLRALEGLPPMPLPGSHPTSPPAVFNPTGPTPRTAPASDEAAIKKWHTDHDKELQQLEQRLVNAPCILENDDVWAMFVRNWGNQGYCSSHDSRWSKTAVTFRLPMKGATAVTAVWAGQCPDPNGSGTCFLSRGIGGGGPYIDLVPNEGALVTFTLPSPDAHERINGELHLNWTVSPSQSRIVISSSLVAHRPEIEVQDDQIARGLNKLSAAEKKQFLKNIPQKEVIFDEVPLRAEMDRSTPLNLKRASRSRGAEITQSKLDPAIEEQRAKRMELLRKVIDSKVDQRGNP
jgi:hypothetical protein